MRYFLVVYDRSRGRRRELIEFAADERARALEERARRERDALEQPEVEVVLLAAESRADLERTHGRYFKSVEELAKAG